MPAAARIGVLVIGAALVLGALLCALIPDLRARIGRAARWSLGVAGAAIVAAVLVLASPFEAAPPVPAGEATSGVEQSATASAPASAPAAPAATPDATAAPAATPTDPLVAEIVASARSAFSDCRLPTPPTTIPNGAVAERAEMIMAQTSVKQYDAAISAYDKCLGTKMDGLRTHFKDKASAQQMQALESVRDRLNNAAVDADQSVANQFNQQIRAFNAKHGHS